MFTKSNENSRSPKKVEVFAVQSPFARPALDIPLKFRVAIWPFSFLRIWYFWNSLWPNLAFLFFDLKTLLTLKDKLKIFASLTSHTLVHCTLSLSLTNKHTNSDIPYTHTHTHILLISVSHWHTHIHTLYKRRCTHTLPRQIKSRSLSHSNTHTHILIHFHTNTHTTWFTAECWKKYCKSLQQ